MVSAGRARCGDDDGALRLRSTDDLEVGPRLDCEPRRHGHGDAGAAASSAPTHSRPGPGGASSRTAATPVGHPGVRDGRGAGSSSTVNDLDGTTSLRSTAITLPAAPARSSRSPTSSPRRAVDRGGFAAGRRRAERRQPRPGLERLGRPAEANGVWRTRSCPRRVRRPDDPDSGSSRRMAGRTTWSRSSSTTSG
jgi:hypothetical protein